jgi:hypothetical protein
MVKQVGSIVHAVGTNVSNARVATVSTHQGERMVLTLYVGSQDAVGSRVSSEEFDELAYTFVKANHKSDVEKREDAVLGRLTEKYASIQENRMKRLEVLAGLAVPKATEPTTDTTAESAEDNAAAEPTTDIDTTAESAEDTAAAKPINNAVPEPELAKVSD